MFADYHVHSYFSEDTDFPMELEIQKAIKLGMNYVLQNIQIMMCQPSLIVIMMLILKKWKE